MSPPTLNKTNALFQKHHYGPRVHLIDDAFHFSLLSRLCHPNTVQPEINRAVAKLYQQLLTTVVNQELEQEDFQSSTRMTSHYPQQKLTGRRVKPEQKLVCVDLMRAGIYPSQVCYEELHWVVSPENVRQDHLFAARVTEDSSKGLMQGGSARSGLAQGDSAQRESSETSKRVIGTEISAHKIGGDIENALVLFPDPMGATGTTIITALDFYKKSVPGKAKKFVALHLIVTPEYLKQALEAHPDLEVYAFRLDRGLSAKDVLESELGRYWSQERGLTENDYIVPGAGGFGEIMNNAYV